LIRIVIADDEKMIRDGLALTMPWAGMGIEVAGVAADGEGALELIREARPRIVITDVRMPRMDGLELLRRVGAEFPETRVVMLSGFDEFAYVREAVKGGAVDYLLKPVTAEELREVITRVKERISAEARGLTQDREARRAVEGCMASYRTAARLGQSQAAKACLDSIYGDERVRSLSTQRQKELFLEMTDGVVADLCREGFELSGDDLLDGLVLDSAQVDLSSPGEMREWVYRFTDAIADIVKGSGAEKGPAAVRQAVEYLEARFREDISAESVASAVLLSPNYFSHVFKKARGEGFTDCLNRLRIEEAKRLLAQGGHKVYEVSEMVGYRDYKYFGAVFKKLVGVSPNSYRPPRPC
jgi:two-component system response regulator YesN